MRYIVSVDGKVIAMFRYLFDADYYVSNILSSATIYDIFSKENPLDAGGSNA